MAQICFTFQKIIFLMNQIIIGNKFENKGRKVDFAQIIKTVEAFVPLSYNSRISH